MKRLDSNIETMHCVCAENDLTLSNFQTITILSWYSNNIIVKSQGDCGQILFKYLYYLSYQVNKTLFQENNELMH